MSGDDLVSGDGRHGDHRHSRAAEGRAVAAAEGRGRAAPADLAALAERLGYHLDDAQIAEMLAAVEAAEPAAARLRTDPLLGDGWPVDPAHGDAWLRR